MNEKQKKDKKLGTVFTVIFVLIEVLSNICGITGYNIKDLMEGVKIDTQAIVETYCNKALDLYTMGKYEEALELSNQIVELDNSGVDIENMETVYYNRGMTLYKMEMYQSAIEDFTQAININDKSKYYIARANAYEKLGDMENYILNNTMGMLKTLN